MRKILIGTILAVTAVSAQAKVNVAQYCNDYAYVTAEVYNMKEDGYSKSLVLKKINRLPGNKSVADDVVNLAYDIPAGLTHKKVFDTTKSTCIQILTKRLAKENK